MVTGNITLVLVFLRPYTSLTPTIDSLSSLEATVALGIVALALFSTCGLKAQLFCTSRTRVQSDSPRLRLLQCDSLSIRRMNPRYILVSKYRAECLYLSCYDLNT
ncbi:hypothetical protein R3P38DRAFT_3063994 [Favolaschia claudopus]|uniref:Uncharacterized protein n=1 Tax=Favolaschia claudopus TaxID=2862362 RepID=A0AAW0A1G0_9AGAR